VKQIRVLVLEPLSTRPARAALIEDSLAGMQGVVGGYIERVALVEPFELYCNEDGLLQRLAPNLLASRLAGQLIVGRAFIARRDGEGLTDMTDEDCLRF